MYFVQEMIKAEDKSRSYYFIGPKEDIAFILLSNLLNWSTAYMHKSV